MSRLPQTIADLVALDHLPRQATADDGTLHVLFWQSPAVRSMLAADWPPPLPADPTPAESAATAAALQAAAQQAEQDAAALRTKVRTVAQSAVGTAFDQLTAAQLRALVGVLLWESGALDKNGVVRPLADWVR